MMKWVRLMKKLGFIQEMRLKSIYYLLIFMNSVVLGASFRVPDIN